MSSTLLPLSKSLFPYEDHWSGPAGKKIRLTQFFSFSARDVMKAIWREISTRGHDSKVVSQACFPHHPQQSGSIQQSESHLIQILQSKESFQQNPFGSKRFSHKPREVESVEWIIGFRRDIHAVPQARSLLGWNTFKSFLGTQRKKSCQWNFCVLDFELPSWFSWDQQFQFPTPPPFGKNSASWHNASCLVFF